LTTLVNAHFSIDMMAKVFSIDVISMD